MNQKINKTYSGPRGWTKKLLENNGEKTVRSYWIENGSRKTAYYFGVPVSTIDHCKITHQWTRPMELVPGTLLGVARGNRHPRKYPHLEFTVPKHWQKGDQKAYNQRYAYYLMKKDTFIGFCILNDGYTYCHDIYMWIRGDKKMDWVETYDDLIQAMKQDKSGYFEPRHFDKVDTVFGYYSKRDPFFQYENQGKPQQTI